MMPGSRLWTNYTQPIDMQKQTVRQTVSCKAFILSSVDCVRLPENLEQKFRIMANLMIDRFLAERAKREQKSEASMQ